MRAVCWEGKGRLRVETVPDPLPVNPQDAIVKVTSTAICGSDLHLYGGLVPTMKKGDILGHEFMGEVVETGGGTRSVRKGDRVVAGFVIACGECYFCKNELYALCDNSNPNAAMEEKVYGAWTAGIFGYSHLYGGYHGGQAEYARVPFADHTALRVPEGVPDEKLLFLSDIFPTGYMAAENCSIRPGDTVAVWGCGPVGQFAIRSAFMLGAERVLAIDRFADRLNLASQAGAVTLDYENEKDLIEHLKEMTGGLGPDACIDAVGMEAHGSGPAAAYDKVKSAVKLETDRPVALRQALQACRKGGTVSIPGVYGGMIDKVPMGAAFAKGLTLKMGQTHVPRYMKLLLERVMNGDIDPSFVVSHRRSLEDAPECYEMFRNKEHECVKCVLTP